MEQALRGIDPCAVPSQQRPHGEGVTEGMDVRRYGAYGHGEPETRDQGAEHAPDLLTAKSTSSETAEERRTTIETPVQPATRGQISVERRTDARPEGHQTILAELGAADDQELPRLIDIVNVEATNLSNAQTEAVQNGEDGVVGLAAQCDAWSVGQARCQIQEAARLIGREDEGRSRIACTTGRAEDR